MVFNYAKELQGNTDKFVMKYVSEIVKNACNNKLIILEDLYNKKEDDLCSIFSKNFKSWNYFNNATSIKNSENKPLNNFYISFETKKRNTIPLVKCNNKIIRINEISNYAKEIYENLNKFKDYKYAYVEEIEDIV